MYNMKGYKFKNEDEDKRQKLHGSNITTFIDELEKEKKQNLKDEKRKKKKKAKKQLQGIPNNSATTKPQNNCNDTQKEPEQPKDPSEDAEYLVGYGTNAMIYNNNAGESDSSEDEGIEDYKISGYPPIHIG